MHISTCTHILQDIHAAGHQWLTPVILATQEAEIRRIMAQSQSQANSSQDTISKIPNTKKRAGRVTHVVDCLPSKCEALSSNPSTTKKKTCTHACTLPHTCTHTVLTCPHTHTYTHHAHVHTHREPPEHWLSTADLGASVTVTLHCALPSGHVASWEQSLPHGRLGGTSMGKL
jgi:hypothetical protein